MAKIPVLAYYYSTDDLVLINRHLEEWSRTESYLYGGIATSDIPLLRNAGILLDILRTAPSQVDTIPQSIRKSSIGSRSALIDIPVSLAATETSYYLLSFTGPLFDARKDDLNDRQITLLERVGDNLYKAKLLDPVQLEQIDYLHSYRPFGNQDKDIVTSRSLSRDVFDSQEEKIAIYDVLLHGENDLDKLVKYLEGQSIEILNVGNKKVRVKLDTMKRVIDIGQREEVEAIEEYIIPQLHNDLARRQLHIDLPEADNSYMSIEWQGEGQVVGVADTGIDDAHPDLSDRLLTISALGRSGDHTDPNGHGTHVAGSIVGTGKASNGQIRGMAPKAKLVFQSLLDSNGGIGGIPQDLHELFKEAYDQGVRIHNNSWGAATESEYRFNSLEVDEFIYHHKDMLLVISAGNEGTSANPRNSQSGFVDWLSVGSPATAKNALTIGASRSMRKSGGFSVLSYGQAWPAQYPDTPIKDAKVSGDPESIAGFSSRGPCGNESRIKPDVVAPGTDIASTKSSLAPSTNFWGPYPKNRNYAFMGGTSMSAPVVTGFAVLVREYFVKQKNHQPSAALLKSAIINGTRQLEGPDALADHNFVPNFHQGFGCVDMLQTLPTNLQPELGLQFIDSWQNGALQLNSTGQRFLFRITCQEGTPLRLCLTWTDPPGRGLQNNLNLLLLHKDTESKWTGNEELPRSITSFDRDNNVEIIRLEDPKAGEYWVAIQADNILFKPQDFALVVTGNLKSDLEQIS